MKQNIYSYQINQLNKMFEYMKGIRYCCMRSIIKCNKIQLEDMYSLCDSKEYLNSPMNL